ncbi:hypothetical protein POKO110462_01845 [Pontibacter korlensis]|uniref:Uncharacterized protein n=1 Tax=Pontibacter korlensis TaxID=400092 RepID=A0A0E3ZGZ3_9BACT|nr:hypothetical protein [Pontibacter korlensis]AKD03764.1 hypothetical protein PKOR_12305 [Pontibacter korlensis]
MKAKDLLAFIPEGDLAFLAAQTQVDHQVKKLSGRVMFQLLLLSLLDGGRASLERHGGTLLLAALPHPG